MGAGASAVSAVPSVSQPKHVISWGFGSCMLSVDPSHDSPVNYKIRRQNSGIDSRLLSENKQSFLALLNEPYAIDAFRKFSTDSLKEHINFWVFVSVENFISTIDDCAFDKLERICRRHKCYNQFQFDLDSIKAGSRKGKRTNRTSSLSRSPSQIC